MMDRFFGWITRRVFFDYYAGDNEDQPRIIALSRGRSWEDYPVQEVRVVAREYRDADIVIDVFGNVVKDREGSAPRPATQEEIRRAVTV